MNLFILGNGFDLMAGIKSTIQMYLEKNGENIDNNPTEWDFWSRLFSIENAADNIQRIKSWTDIEDFIYRVVMYVYKEESTELSNDELRFIEACLGQRKDETAEKKLNYIYSELIKFDSNFAKYLGCEVDQLTDQGQLIKMAKDDFWNENINNNNVFEIYPTDTILNFNYTQAYPPKIPKKNQVNIHGSLITAHNAPNNNVLPIIFGFDQQKLKKSFSDHLINKFTKTFQKLEFNHIYSNIQNSKFLSTDITDIYFIGHSLNESDWGYFYSIFDYLDLYNNHSLHLHFLFSKKFSIQSPTSFGEYENAIYRLINTYGSELKNSENGSYLLNKLMLEERISTELVVSTH